MDLKIKGRKALVTGAGRGLGRSIEQSLASEGVKVACVSRTKTDLDDLLNSIGGVKDGDIGIAMYLMPDTAPKELPLSIF